MIANKDIFQVIFPLNEQEIDQLDPDTLLDEDAGWDSMAKVMLISEVSETRDKVIEADDLEALKTMKDLDNLISSFT